MNPWTMFSLFSRGRTPADGLDCGVKEYNQDRQGEQLILSGTNGKMVSETVVECVFFQIHKFTNIL